MFRSSFILGIVATSAIPKSDAVRLARRIRALRGARKILIMHLQEDPGTERFASFTVDDVIVAANRRRTLSDPKLIEQLIDSFEASGPRLRKGSVDCSWVVRFFASTGAVLDTFALDNFGSSGSIRGASIEFARPTLLLGELSKLVPDRPITNAERHRHIRMPGERPGEHSH